MKWLKRIVARIILRFFTPQVYGKPTIIESAINHKKYLDSVVYDYLTLIGKDYASFLGGVKDYAAELLIDEKGNLDFKFVPIDRWYDPQCIPAIVSDVRYSKPVELKIYLQKHPLLQQPARTIKSDILSVLYAIDRYFYVDDELFFELPKELLSTAVEHFQKRELRHLVNGTEHNGFKPRLDKNHNQVQQNPGQHNQINPGTGRDKYTNNFDSDWYRKHFCCSASTIEQTAKFKASLEQLSREFDNFLKTKQ